MRFLLPLLLLAAACKKDEAAAPAAAPAPSGPAKTAGIIAIDTFPVPFVCVRDKTWLTGPQCVQLIATEKPNLGELATTDLRGECAPEETEQRPTQYLSFTSWPGLKRAPVDKESVPYQDQEKVNAQFGGKLFEKNRLGLARLRENLYQVGSSKWVFATLVGGKPVLSGELTEKQYIQALADLDEDGQVEALIFGESEVVLMRLAQDKWVDYRWPLCGKKFTKQTLGDPLKEPTKLQVQVWFSTVKQLPVEGEHFTFKADDTIDCGVEADGRWSWNDGVVEGNCYGKHFVFIPTGFSDTLMASEGGALMKSGAVTAPLTGSVIGLEHGGHDTPLYKKLVSTLKAPEAKDEKWVGDAWIDLGKPKKQPAKPEIRYEKQNEAAALALAERLAPVLGPVKPVKGQTRPYDVIVSLGK